MDIRGNNFFLASGGQLVTDRFGMSSAVAMWFYSGPSPENAVGIHSRHPRWNFLDCDKTIVTRRPDGAWDIQATYFGVVGTPDPIYSLEQTLGNEPIETHPNFETFAGTYSSPLNGAYFDPTDQMFVNFKQATSGSGGDGSVTNRQWVGVRDYLAPGMVWRKTYTTKSKPSTTNVGHTTNPPGNPPTPTSIGAGTGYNWLAMGMSYDQKGLTYQVREEWRLSGPNGWNTDLYPAGTAV